MLPSLIRAILRDLTSDFIPRCSWESQGLTGNTDPQRHVGEVKECLENDQIPQYGDANPRLESRGLRACLFTEFLFHPLYRLIHLIIDSFCAKRIVHDHFLVWLNRIFWIQPGFVGQQPFANGYVQGASVRNW